MLIDVKKKKKRKDNEMVKIEREMLVSLGFYKTMKKINQKNSTYHQTFLRFHFMTLRFNHEPIFSEPKKP